MPDNNEQSEENIAQQVFTYAELAQKSANTAQENANKSIEAASEATTNANQALASAQTSTDNANDSVQSATTAKNHANNADVSASAAKGFANNASASAAEAKNKSDEASANADDTKIFTKNASDQADLAKAKADEAAVCASAADVKSGEASASADKAYDKADESEQDAARAKKEADAAAASATSANDNAKTTEISASHALQQLEKAKAATSRAEDEANRAAKAHNLSTTAGLAGAFNMQAEKATQKLIIWGFALAIVLVLIIFLGAARYEKVVTLIDALVGKDQLLETIGAQILFFLLGIAAPVWFAWVATKMISKYFHLSEDYSYKAAIAKAYVGFRDEAENLDPIFKERLFAAAVTQLDANPLRFFDGDKHPGSPLQDLLQQPFMRAFMQENDEFKEGVTAWMKGFFKTSFYIPIAVLKVAKDMASTKDAEKF